MTEDEILALFHPTFKDDIESIRLFPPIPGTRGFAFLEFKDAMSAIRAFTSKHRTMFTYRGVQKKLNLSRPTKGKPDDDQSKWEKYEERLRQSNGRPGAADSTPRRMTFSKGVAVAPRPPGAVQTVPFAEVFRALAGTAPPAPPPEPSVARSVEATGNTPSQSSSSPPPPKPAQTRAEGSGGIPVFEAQEPAGHSVVRRSQVSGPAERKPAGRATISMNAPKLERPASPIRRPSPPRAPEPVDPFADPPPGRPQTHPRPPEDAPPPKKRATGPVDSNPFRTPVESLRHSPSRDSGLTPSTRSRRPPPERSFEPDPFRPPPLSHPPPMLDSGPFEALVSNPDNDPFEERQRHGPGAHGNPFADRLGAFLRS
eukprot:EG_transcript_11233